MQLSARDKRALILGSIIVLALLAYLLWPRTDPQTGVELVPASERPAARVGPAAPAASPPAPITVQTVRAAPAPAPAAVAAPAGTIPDGLGLRGVTATGAIFALADGSQRFVERGRDVVPGVRLEGMSLDHVILTTATGAYRLGFAGPPKPLAAPGAPPLPAR